MPVSVFMLVTLSRKCRTATADKEKLPILVVKWSQHGALAHLLMPVLVGRAAGKITHHFSPLNNKSVWIFCVWFSVEKAQEFIICEFEQKSCKINLYNSNTCSLTQLLINYMWIIFTTFFDYIEIIAARCKASFW